MNLRDEVAAAFDSVAEESGDPVELETAGPDTETVETPEGEEVDTGEGAEADAGDGVDPPAPVIDTQAAATTADAPPASWSAAEKASWAKLPAELKAPILRREKEIRETVRIDGTARKFVDSIKQTIQPYSALLEKTGLNPVNVMQESLVLAQAMQTGSPAEKAATIGKMIKHFNIDIDELDKYIVDPQNAKPAAPAGPVYNPRTDPALSSLFSLAEQVQAKTAEANEKLIAEASAWPQFEESRNAMADLMEWSEERGQKMTLAQAYTRITGLAAPAKASVTTLVPDTKKPSQQQISQAAAVLAKSRKAASSVVGSRRAAPEIDTNDIRATVAAAANGLL